MLRLLKHQEIDGSLMEPFDGWRRNLNDFPTGPFH